MKVKAFKIRLGEEFLPADQETVNDFLGTVNVKKTSTELVHGQYWSLLAFYDDGGGAAYTKTFLPSEKELSEEGQRIYEALKQWRFDKASVLGLPAYLISSNGELITIAKVKPQSIDDLAKIRGYGGQKIAKYGEEIIALLNSVA